MNLRMQSRARALFWVFVLATAGFLLWALPTNAQEMPEIPEVPHIPGAPTVDACGEVFNEIPLDFINCDDEGEKEPDGEQPPQEEEPPEGDVLDEEDPDTQESGGSSGGSSGGGGSRGNVVNILRPNGFVLGAETECIPLINDYLRLGWNNNPFEVMKLQAFLNGHMNSGLAIHGIFDIAVMDAVRAFQLLHWEEILKPWVPLGLASEITPTGFVYKTTKHFINSTACPNLELEMPILP